jgi:hypothetical protein
MAPNPG